MPFVGNADSAGWLKAMDKMIALQPAVVVPGSRPGVARRRARPRADARLSRVPARDDGRRGRADLEPFDDVYARTDWSRFRALPAFEPANRINAYGTYLLMEQEILQGAEAMTIANDPVLAVAIRAARTRRQHRVDAARDLKRLPTFSKEHGDIVSGADMEAEDAIIATHPRARSRNTRSWARSRATSRAHAKRSGYQWIVDPIDGTANFVHGFPYYAVSDRARARHGNHARGGARPGARRALHRGEGQGRVPATASPIHVSACLNLTDALVAPCSRTRASPKLAAYLPTFNALITQCAGLRRAGSARSISRISPRDGSTASG